MQDLPFIASNPAMDEYNRANKIAADQQTQDLTNQGKVLSNQGAALKLQTDTAEAPSRLKLLQAQTSEAGTKAQYAPQEARARIAGMNARVAATHMEAFTKSLDLLDAGDVEGAKRAAAMVGDQIPDAIVQNHQMRAAVKGVTETAKQLYPNRPKDQMTYIHAHITTLGEQAQQNQPINPQTAPYAPVAGVPEPQETGGVKLGETERIIEHLMANDKKLTYADAVGLAKRAPTGDTLTLRKETLALNAAKSDPNYQNDPNATLEGWRAKYGLQPMAAPTPAAVAAPPQQAIDYLKANPALAPAFDQKYGQGASQRVLGAPQQ
jgi:hypothetical protein